MSYKTDFSKIDTHNLNVFAESRKRRIFVGTLKWDEVKSQFEFRYDPKYARSKKAIPIGKELDLFKKVSTSKKLFPSFADRIPSKENPAYEDYCIAQGISIDEVNPIILLVSIGRKGPSTFIFEPIIKNEFTKNEVKEFRDRLGISLQDLALAFDFNWPTLQRLEAGKKVELSTLRRLQIYFDFPHVALWQLSLTIGKLHSDTFNRLWTYFENQKKRKKETNPNNKRQETIER